ncbi:Lrp/AsnC family transcriptional regulator [Phreatobacter aquaticus]|uniref:Lrp/AsnC family transcriptional regulator n=1 Tax=Phreatobacter aquaticus TaxID=2570229 RepID=A0A4D7QQ58_9HYPH|nr:Lrp/AsnC family transcriptional regulator [Phreatobacter aquaticus]QCK87766.1 Lrp/AsnC family transcriptional regulator [Phreatobacter aquaticus]
MRLTLDAIDHRIIQHLRADGRMSNADLAAAVGLSPSACLRRVRLLEESGTIRGYTALIDENRTGNQAVVIAQITLERQTEDYLNRFEAAIRKCPEVRKCDLMTGMSDYLVRVEIPSAADYERVHKDILSRLPGVSRIHSSFAIRSVL